jgi:hypothetical protein
VCSVCSVGNRIGSVNRVGPEPGRLDQDQDYDHEHDRYYVFDQTPIERPRSLAPPVGRSLCRVPLFALICVIRGKPDRSVFVCFVGHNSGSICLATDTTGTKRVFRFCGSGFMPRRLDLSGHKAPPTVEPSICLHRGSRDSRRRTRRPRQQYPRRRSCVID